MYFAVPAFWVTVAILAAIAVAPTLFAIVVFLLKGVVTIVVAVSIGVVLYAFSRRPPPT